MELDAAVKLWAESSDKIEAIHQRVMTATEPKPVRKNIGVTNTVSALTSQTLVLPQSPAAGRMWFIHRVVILGADGHTAVASAVADIYTGPSALPDAPSQIYSALTLPTIIVEGRHHNPVLHGELVYAILTGLPANQVVQFAVGVDEFLATDVLAMSL